MLITKRQIQLIRFHLARGSIPEHLLLKRYGERKLGELTDIEGSELLQRSIDLKRQLHRERKAYNLKNIGPKPRNDLISD